jgi:hypothetical protein
VANANGTASRAENEKTNLLSRAISRSRSGVLAYCTTVELRDCSLRDCVRQSALCNSAVAASVLAGLRQCGVALGLAQAAATFYWRVERIWIVRDVGPGRSIVGRKASKTQPKEVT